MTRSAAARVQDDETIDVAAEAARQAGMIAAIDKVQAIIEFDLDGTIRDANQNFLAALGYRIDDAAYTPDLHDIPEESWPALEGLDLWIVDGLRYAQHPSHFSVRDALKWIDRFNPKRAVITNMHADLDYEVMRKELPANVIPAYDGMRLTLTSD